MKIKHFLFLVLLLPLTGCVLFSDPVPPLVYYTYGNSTDKTITVKTYKADKVTMTSSFTIAPGEEYTYPVRRTGGSFDGGSSFVSVSNGKYMFVQSYSDSFFPNYLFSDYYYQQTRIKDKVIYYKYVFSDKDFEFSSGNNIEEVPQLK